LAGFSVKYLIDKKSLDPFKQFYIHSEYSKVFVDYYDMEGEELVKDFKYFLR